MIRHHRLEHRFVDDIPEKLEPGLLYVSMRYATAMHLCCCGCGREVVTPLSPAQWQLSFDGESISLRPSIGSWNIPCRSHYIIKNGGVIEATTWSEESVAYGQARDRRARALYYTDKDAPETEVEPERASAPMARRGWVRWLDDFFRKYRRL